MRYRLLDLLRCPSCGAEKNWILGDIDEREDPGVVDGKFDAGACSAFTASRYYPHSYPETAGAVCWRVKIESGDLICGQCGTNYAIENGIPRMTLSNGSHAHDGLQAVKDATSNSFGFEWNYYNDFGWKGLYNNDSMEPLGHERNVFFKKAQVVPGEFDNKVILDAGCGNGRYTYWARQLGGEVIGVDLSHAVDAAAKNLAAFPDVHIVQGDIFNLPVLRNAMDRIFSIGVLMHTGDARAAFESLLAHLKPGGIITIHTYKRGNPVYERVDAWLRSRTVGMDFRKLQAWSRNSARIASLLSKSRRLTFGVPMLYSVVNSFVHLESVEIKQFDWYSAPVATHHTYREVFRWFEENNCEVVSHRNQEKDILRRLLNSPMSAVTVKGVKVPQKSQS